MEMDIKELTNPAWWLSVVAMGLALNILSAYIKNWIDRTFLASTRWWRNLSEKRTTAFNELVASIAAASDKEQFHLKAFSHSIRSLHALGLAIFSLVLGTSTTSALSSPTAALLGPYIFLLMCLVSYFFLLSSLSEYWRMRRLEAAIREAQRHPKGLDIKQPEPPDHR